jgi:predicted RNase H-like nuclease (RuvC/YqgF family)
MKNKMTSQQKQDSERGASVPAELEEAKQLAAAVEQLQTEVADLKRQLQILNRKSATTVCIAFAVPGILALGFSVVTDSQVLASSAWA